MELETKIMSLARCKGRPFSSLLALVNRYERVTNERVEFLNDRLVKINSKYYSISYYRLNNPIIQFLECNVYSGIILAHYTKRPIPVTVSDNAVNLEYDDLQVTFAFDTNGDFVDHKTISKLAMLGLVKEYKIFTY